MISSATLPVSPQSVVALANNHFSVDHEGSTIIMSITAGRYFAFDEIAFEIWDGLKEPTRLDALAETLAAKHNAPVEKVTSDVVEFVTKLADAQLVVVS